MAFQNRYPILVKTDLLNLDLRRLANFVTNKLLPVNTAGEERTARSAAEVKSANTAGEERTARSMDDVSCGTHRKFLKSGLTAEEIRNMGEVFVCQFPGCLVESDSLHSDHFHDGNKINPENYRGEICMGHNLLLSDLDARPEWANEEALEYMNRRPYSRKEKTIC